MIARQEIGSLDRRVVDSWGNTRPCADERQSGAHGKDIHSEFLREKAPSEGGDIHAWGFEAGETTIVL